MNKLRITYDPNLGLAVADGNIAITVENTISMFKSAPEKWSNHTFGSELVFNQFRIAVKDGLIDCNDIVFVFNGEELDIQPNGRMMHWPDGFGDVLDRQLDRLLD